MSRSRSASACLSLEGVSAGTRSWSACASAIDGDIAIGFGRGYFGVALDARDVRAAHVGDVLILVAYFLDGEAHDFEPHLAHIVGARRAHVPADHFRLLHDLLDRELPDDAA